MHPVANQVEIPTDKISEALERCAVPGFTGSVTAHIRVLPSAAHEVEFRFEQATMVQINKPTDPETPLVTNARVNKVRRVLMENAQRFRLGTPLSRVLASFVDGELRKFEIVEVSEKCQV
jgi:hypothetical protein